MGPPPSQRPDRTVECLQRQCLSYRGALLALAGLSALLVRHMRESGGTEVALTSTTGVVQAARSPVKSAAPQPPRRQLTKVVWPAPGTEICVVCKLTLDPPTGLALHQSAVIIVDRHY